MTNSESIQFLQQDYLNRISETVTSETIASYKSIIKPFAIYCQDRSLSPSQIQGQHVAEFLISRFPHCSWITIAGRISELANFLAYLQRDEPELVKIRIGKALQDCVSNSPKTDWPTSQFLPEISASLENSVMVFRDEIEQRRFGSRLHIFIELIVATSGRPESVRRLNRSDLCLESRNISLSLPETSAVGSSALIPKRTVPIPSELITPIETYLQHEYIPSTDLANEPLFATPHGRISASSIRRTIKQASAAILENHNSTTGVARSDSRRDGDPNSLLTLRDIRLYSLTQIMAN